MTINLRDLISNKNLGIKSYKRADAKQMKARFKQTLVIYEELPISINGRADSAAKRLSPKV